MTIKELRMKYNKMLRFAKATNSDLIEYYKEIWETMETLYKYGYITEFSMDFLAIANGYVVNTQNYENFHIRQTLGLHDISATKSAAKDIMAYWIK